MLRKFARLSLWMLSLVFVLLSATLLCGAQQMGTDKTSSQQTVTGCLQKGGEPVGFFIVSADGTHWELYPSAQVALANHVGHTVTVKGSLAKRSPAQEEKASRTRRRK